MTTAVVPVDVVTVNYNAGAALLESVRAVLASSVSVAVWVVDNASSDGSLERLERELGAEPRLRVIRNRANLGFARANNQVLRQHLAGEYALLLNPDCAVQPRTLETVRAALAVQPDAGMAGCLLLGLDGREQAGCRRTLPTPGAAFARAFGLTRPLRRLLHSVGGELPDFVLSDRPLPAGVAEVEAISGAFMLVRRRALEQVGLLDEGYFLHGEDLDWCLRFGQAGQRVLFVPGAVAVHEKGRCSRRRPLSVQWHLHRSMTRYHLKHHRPATPLALSGLVLTGIWLRFGARALPVAVWSAARRRLAG